MSRDIFVQDLPPGIASVGDIPDEFVPQPLAVTRAEVIAALSAEAPHTNISDPASVTIAVPGRYHIEANLGTSERLEHFAFHVRGGAGCGAADRASTGTSRLASSGRCKRVGSFHQRSAGRLTR